MKKIFSVLMASVIALSITACGVANSSDDNSEWKTFIAEYDAWVDEYIELMDEMESNPSDLSLLGDISKMAGEVAEWQTKADDVKASLEGASSSELQEYSQELARIAAKLAGTL